MDPYILAVLVTNLRTSLFKNRKIYSSCRFSFSSFLPAVAL